MLPGTRHATLETPIEGLRVTPPTTLPFLANAQVRSFILERPEGNAIVYNSPGLSEAVGEIRALGDATHLLTNHGHEAMYGPPRLNVPAFVHERDRAETARGLPVAGTFTHRQMIDDDLEVIPTPGHTWQDLVPLGQRHAPLPVHRRLTLGRVRRLEGRRALRQ